MFTHPSNFNDPFDCTEYLFKTDLSDQKIDDILEESNINLSVKDIEDLKINLRNTENVADTIKNLTSYKISCFTERYDEVLMWSHYADKHNGICIGFKFPLDYKEEFVLCNAKYLEEIKPQDGNKTFLEDSLHWLISKSKRWYYEKEVRAILKSSSNQNEVVHFNTNYIKEILFGCKVSLYQIESAIQFIKKSGLDIELITFKHMRIDKGTFLLKEEIINLKNLFKS